MGGDEDVAGGDKMPIVMESKSVIIVVLYFKLSSSNRRTEAAEEAEDDAVAVDVDMASVQASFLLSRSVIDFVSRRPSCP